MYKTAFERYEEAKRNTSTPEQCLQYQQKLFLNELYQKQEKERLIEEVLDGFYVLEDREQYNSKTGLVTDNHWLEEILIQ